jgi:hypothetical protein
VLADFAQGGNGGLIVTPSPLTATKRDVLIGVAEKLKLPTVYQFRFYVESGGLVSYGIDQLETVREAASYVDRWYKSGRSSRSAANKIQLGGELKDRQRAWSFGPGIVLVVCRRGDRIARHAVHKAQL